MTCRPDIENLLVAHLVVTKTGVCLCYVCELPQIRTTRRPLHGLRRLFSPASPEDPSVLRPKGPVSLLGGGVVEPLLTLLIRLAGASGDGTGQGSGHRRCPGVGGAARTGEQ